MNPVEICWVQWKSVEQWKSVQRCSSLNGVQQRPGTTEFIEFKLKSLISIRVQILSFGIQIFLWTSLSTLEVRWKFVDLDISSTEFNESWTNSKIKNFSLEVLWTSLDSCWTDYEVQQSSMSVRRSSMNFYQPVTLAILYNSCAITLFQRPTKSYDIYFIFHLILFYPRTSQQPQLCRHMH